MTNQEFLESITQEGEEWRDVIGYEGLYAVSNYGRIVSLSRPLDTWFGTRVIHPSIMTPQPHKRGYRTVILRQHGKIKHFLVHRLVAESFIPNPHSYQEIDHIDGCKTNNRYDNLQWCDRTINMNNPNVKSILSKAAAKKTNERNHKSKPIVAIPISDGETLIFPSSCEANRYGGFNQGAISACCLGKRKFHKGYKWFFLSDY